METVRPKYNIDDKVWVITNNHVCYTMVTAAIVTIGGKNRCYKKPRITYEIEDSDELIPEDFVCATKEELLSIIEREIKTQEEVGNQTIM